MRALAFFVALLVLLVSLSAEAKKKKGGKKGKTPAAKSKGKSTEAAPAPEEESDEASSDEKSSSTKAAGASEEEEAAPKPPPPPPEEEQMAPRKKAPKAKAPAPEEGEGGAAPVALRFGVGGAALFRTLGWTGSNGMLASYSLSPGPEASLWFEAFPAAFATGGFAANIGVFARFDYGFGASSKTPPPQNTTLTTKYQDLLAGLKIRIPFGSFIPYVAGAYGMQKFHLEPNDIGRPNFDYSYIHFGAGARIQFTPAIDLELGGGYLLVSNPGTAANDIKALYPRTTAYGGAFNASLGFRLTGLIGVRVGVDLRQFGLNTHYQSTDMGVPTAGAADRYITAYGGLELIFDGVGGGGGEEEAAPVKKPAKAKKPAPTEGEEPEVSTDKPKPESETEE